MKDFEKLGVFYLGKEYDLEKKKTQQDLVLLKSKDLTTHAVIIGMTGSGKTGLGIGMIEEAAIDNIPVIAIDPKGDLGNLALTFPSLQGEEFKPWVNSHEAENKGLTTEEYAQSQAQLWEKGLAEWGQDGQRIEMFRNAAEVKIYTPGSSAGIGVSILKSFQAPPLKIINDQDAYRDRISITTSGLLSLIGFSGDILTSREHVLIANILDYFWQQNLDLGLAELIASIQKPPLDKIGVLDMESFYPSKDRFALAMMFNNLLASPSFKVWLEGEALDINSFLYDHRGQPRVSVFSISHLQDSERMFFVTMLLNEILSWVRTQPGTDSLRALLYMDELFGFLPPTANPPSKAPLLTLLKQARAFGLGIVLSTQNPVDLDYKALSNAGTWFIGRLQTERDKDRVMSGLEGAALGGQFNRSQTEKVLASLGQRIFYLHSVHQDAPIIFNTRWVLSYLAGPMTRDQIAFLSKSFKQSYQEEPSSENKSKVYSSTANTRDWMSSAPVLPPQIKQIFLPPQEGNIASLVYTPTIIGMVDVLYNNSKHGVNLIKNYTLLAPLHDGPIPLDWNEAKLIDLNLRDLESRPLDNMSYANYPEAAANARNYDQWKKSLNQYVRLGLGLQLFYSPTLKIVSEDGEDERDFRIRLQHLAHEHRDAALEVIKKKYKAKIETLETKRMRAMQALDKQSRAASQKKMDAAITAGSALLGALLGSKKINATSISRVGTAVKSTSKAMQSDQGIGAAEETLKAVEAQILDMESELDKEIAKISGRFDMLNEKLEELEIRVTSGNITIQLVGLAWLPQ